LGVKYIYREREKKIKYEEEEGFREPGGPLGAAAAPGGGAGGGLRRLAAANQDILDMLISVGSCREGEGPEAAVSKGAVPGGLRGLAEKGRRVLFGPLARSRTRARFFCAVAGVRLKTARIGWSGVRELGCAALNDRNAHTLHIRIGLTDLPISRHCQSSL
jgi:hypothetical protein